MRNINYNDYASNFSDSEFWKKISSAIGKTGKDALRLALTLYYVLKDPTVSIVQKGMILGALGYFILPIDLVPDAIPVAGYVDDISVMKVAYEFIKLSITPSVEAQVEATLKEWVG